LRNRDWEDQDTTQFNMDISLEVKEDMKSTTMQQTLNMMEVTLLVALDRIFYQHPDRLSQGKHTPLTAILGY